MKTIKTFLYRTVCGFFIGLSVFAPGISGSVMAIAMGIYQDLVRIVSNPLREMKKNARFLIPLGLGVIISAVLFVLAFQYLFEQHERATLLLFVGLIVGNLPVIGVELKKYPVQKRNLLGGAFAFALALGLGLMAIGAGQLTDAGGSAVSFLEVAVSGFVAGAITLVPGMSISAILIMLGVYGQIIVMARAVLDLQLSYLPQLAWLLIAAILGLVLAAKWIKRAFDKVPALANTCVFGFMTGTALGIFIESLYIADAQFHWALGGVLFLTGLAIATLFAVMGRYMNRRAEDT